MFAKTSCIHGNYHKLPPRRYWLQTQWSSCLAFFSLLAVLSGFVMATGANGASFLPTSPAAAAVSGHPKLLDPRGQILSHYSHRTNHLRGSWWKYSPTPFGSSKNRKVSPFALYASTKKSWTTTIHPERSGKGRNTTDSDTKLKNRHDNRTPNDRTAKTPSTTPTAVATTLSSSSKETSAASGSPAAAVAAVKWPPQTLHDLNDAFCQVYRDLEDKGPVYKQVTDTLCFSYVTPPLPNGTSTWKNPWQYYASNDDSWRPEHNPHKPLAIYLPGLDGYGISAYSYQFGDLARTFELWRMLVDPTDASSFRDVTAAIAEFIEEHTAQADDCNDQEDCGLSRPVLLIGESCGGVLACAATLRLQQDAEKLRLRNNPISGLVLVNPATSFDQTAWDVIVPLITSLQYLDSVESRRDGLTPYSVLGSLLLTALIPDRDQLQRIVDIILHIKTLDIPVQSSKQWQEIWQTVTDSFRETEARLPPEVLKHRVTNWVDVGNAILQPLLRNITVPTLIVAGAQDKLVPSKQEANRLVRLIPHAEKLVVPERGHFVLFDNVNLTEAILYSKLDPLRWKRSIQEGTKRPYDGVTDWKMPSPKDIEKALEQSVRPMSKFFSAVYFSTDQNGKRWMGLSKVPAPALEPNGRRRPMVIVGNHQFMAADLRILFGELYEQRGIVARGLAHAMSFKANGATELAGRTPGILEPATFQPQDFTRDFQKWGALPVTPRNYYRLLQTGQTVLLYPGGAQEALGGRKDYPLFWPEDRVDFVRTAARFNATIVPLSAIGARDSVAYLAGPEFVLQLPMVNRGGGKSKNNNDIQDDDDDDPMAAMMASFVDEEMGFPLFVPRPFPARFYFCFGKPVRTDMLDPNDKEGCARVYAQVQREVRRGLDDLLRARKKDPFRSPAKRMAYENIFGKRAPTFPVSELNKK